MHNKNQISLKQNEEKALQYQALSKVLLEQSAIYTYAVIFLNIIVCIITYIYVDVSNHRGAVLFFALVFAYSINFNRISRQKCEQSAFLKGEFDKYVFGITDHLPNFSSDYKNTLLKKRKKISIYVKNSGDNRVRGVLNWYENVDSEADIFNAAKNCMLQNILFDKGIKSISFKCRNYIIFFLIIIGFYLFGNDSVENLIILIVLIMGPAMQLIIELYFGIKDIQLINTSIETQLGHSSSMNDLETLMIEFTTKRSIVTFDLDLLHLIYKCMSKSSAT